nr:CPBP family intramembrane metalloprotease [Clostridia bacterium]
MRAKNTLTMPILTAVIYLLYLGSHFIDAQLLGYGDSMYLSVIILQLIIFILPGIFYCRVKGEGYSVGLNLRPIAPRKLIFILTSFVVMVTGTILIRLAHFFAVGYTARYTLFDGTVTASVMWDDPMFWYLIVAYAAIPAFCEEFVFRTVLMREYTDSCGEVTAVVMSSLAYAMLPLNFGSFFEQLFCGFVLASVTVITRSSVSAMIMRFAFNTLGIMGDSTLVSIFEQSDGKAFVTVTVLTLMLIFLVITFSEGERLCRFYAYTEVSPPEKQSDPQKITDALFSPSFIACAAIFVISALVL